MNLRHYRDTTLSSMITPAAKPRNGADAIALVPGLQPETVPTLYRLAWPWELPLLQHITNSPEDMWFPTVLGLRGNHIVGVLATQARTDLLVAGPVWIDPALARGGHVFMKLTHIYESALQLLGMRKYWFHIDNRVYPEWARLVQRAGVCSILEQNDNGIWFERTF